MFINPKKDEEKIMKSELLAKKDEFGQEEILGMINEGI
jgi:hypothetical protein